MQAREQETGHNGTHHRMSRPPARKDPQMPADTPPTEAADTSPAPTASAPPPEPVRIGVLTSKIYKAKYREMIFRVLKQN